MCASFNRFYAVGACLWGWAVIARNIHHGRTGYPIKYRVDNVSGGKSGTEQEIATPPWIDLLPYSVFKGCWNGVVWPLSVLSWYNETGLYCTDRKRRSYIMWPHKCPGSSVTRDLSYIKDS
jgi:hypothetical protein